LSWHGIQILIWQLLQEADLDFRDKPVQGLVDLRLWVDNATQLVEK
jgi:hypothetical protein